MTLVGPTLVVPVGPAAAGKSTWLRAQSGAGVLDLVVSTDAVRAELGLDPADTATAYAEAHRRVRAALGAGRVVALDATNVDPRARAVVLDLARGAGAAAVAVRIGVGLTLAELMARDARRDRHVPVRALATKHRQFTAYGRPERLLAEGFDAVADADRCELVRGGLVGLSA